MASKYSKKNQASKKTSVREFKAWLSGVEEMQPSDWVPDASQWKVIRAKIDTISEDQQTTIVNSVTQQPSAPAALSGGGNKEGPLTRGSKPTVKRVADQSAPLVPPPPSTMAMAGMKPDRAPPLIETPDGKIKTPDIDTSKAGYKSPFV